MTVLALVGPTASGKSALAMQVARERGDVEIVAVDAFTIYRGLEVTTAAPSPQDRAEVPHHLVGVLEPSQDVTVAWFQHEAVAAVAAVRDRGRVPLLVGGSGLYFRASVDPLEFPPTDPATRARLERRWDDPQAAHRHLAEVDPDAAGRIEPANLRRTVRALEVFELTGRPFSSYRTAWDSYESIHADLDVAYLEPPTAELDAAIEARTRRMLAEGMLAEVRTARDRWPLSRTAAQAIGVREAVAVLDGRMPEEELGTQVAARTRRYARRQRTWFRRDPRCTPPSAPDEILARWAR